MSIDFTRIDAAHKLADEFLDLLKDILEAESGHSSSLADLKEARSESDAALAEVKKQALIGVSLCGANGCYCKVDGSTFTACEPCVAVWLEKERTAATTPPRPIEELDRITSPPQPLPGGVEGSREATMGQTREERST